MRAMSAQPCDMRGMSRYVGCRPQWWMPSLRFLESGGPRRPPLFRVYLDSPGDDGICVYLVFFRRNCCQCWAETSARLSRFSFPTADHPHSMAPYYCCGIQYALAVSLLNARRCIQEPVRTIKGLQYLQAACTGEGRLHGGVLCCPHGT